MVVDRRDFHAALDQLAHHRVDLGFQQDQVTHGHGATLYRLECDPTAEGEARFDGEAVYGHLKIAARKTVAMNIAGDGPLAAEGIIDLLPIDLLGSCRGRERHNG